MKNFLIICCLTFFATSFSQNERREKIKELKIAHITETLNLSSAEAEKFWPIYNKFDKKIHQLRQRERKEIYGIIKEKGVDNISEIEANNLLNKGIEIQSSMLTAKETFYQEIRKVISGKKILALKKAEDDFKRKLLRKYKGKSKNKEKKEK